MFSKSAKDITRELTKGIVRPDPVAHRLASRPWMRWTVRLAGTSVVLAFALAVVILPVKDYVVQRSAIAEKVSEFEALADANEQLQDEVNHLNTPEGARNAAREQLGYVLPGEQRISLLPMPALPTDLPDVWPYTMVEDIVAVRQTTQATSGNDVLNPLAP